MVSLDKAVIARIMKAGEKFEILVDPEKALELKRGKEVKMEDVLAAREIYSDVGKGLRAPQEKLNRVFGTNNAEQIARKIIFDGELQLTTEQRRKMVEDRRKQIAGIISRQGLNPQTGAPHPIERVLNAMEQAKVQISGEKGAEEQVEDALEKIQRIIPIRFEKVILAIRIPTAYAARSVSVVRSFGKLQKEEWGNDGSYLAQIEIPAGMQPEIFDKLNSITKGEVEVKILNRSK